MSARIRQILIGALQRTALPGSDGKRIGSLIQLIANKLGANWKYSVCLVV